MKDFANPPVGLPYVLLSGAAAVEQMRDRLQSNADLIRRTTPDGEIEPSVELTVDEALLMAENADRLSALLRILGEGRI